MPDKDTGTHLPIRPEPLHPIAAQVTARPITTFEQFDSAVPSLRDYVGILMRRKWIVIISLAVILGAASLYTATAPRIYEATATMLISDLVRGSASRETRDAIPLAAAGMAAPDIETHAVLIQGRSTADATSEWLQGNGGPRLTSTAVREAIRAAAVPKTHLIRVSARARTPRDAQKIANGTATVYADINRRWARGSSESASRYLSEQLVVARNNLAEAENALRAFKESTGTVAEDAEASELLRRAETLRADADKTAADLAQTQERLSRVRAQLAEQNRSISATTVRDNQVIQQLRVRLVDLEGQRLAAEQQYTSAFPGPLNQINEQIRITKRQLNSEIGGIVKAGSGDLSLQQTLIGQFVEGEAAAAALKARQRQSLAELSGARRELQRVPSRQITLARLQRRVEVAQSIHTDLLKRSQEIEVGRVMALGNIDIVEQASAPFLPVKPNVPLNLALGLLLGVAAGIGLALLQEQLDDTVRGEEDAVRFANAPTLATVPMFERHQPSVNIVPHGARGRPGDAYRVLRYNLGFVMPEPGGHTVLVTSSGPKEGKTTTALNLAIAAAASGRRVVLVDSDLRRSTLRGLLDLNGAKGLTDLLAGQASLQEVLQAVENTGLMLIPPGSRAPNPTDLLDSSQMRNLVAQLRGQADLVIFDSPPVLAVADSLVLASMSDAVLMVCVPGVSHRRALRQSRALLQHIGQNVSGVVLNKVEPKTGYGYYYGYYYAAYDQDDAEGDGDAGNGNQQKDDG